MRMFTVITINYIILIMLSILSKNSVDEILKYFSDRPTGAVILKIYLTDSLRRRQSFH